MDKTIKSVIFDLDGVICFTDKFHYLAWKELADKYGIYFDETINNRLRGVSRMDSLKIILEKWEGKPFKEDEMQEMANYKNEKYRSLLSTMTPNDVSNEVVETIKEIKNRGYKVAIGSSSKNTKYILERIGIIELFDAISDGNNITYSKPNPEVFIKAAEYLNEACEECLVVEDAKAGIEAAIAGKMHSAAIGDAVKCNKAEYNLNQFRDLLNILL